MSRIIVCTSKKADNPYTFLNTKVEVYTYEELCFYIYNNTVLISKSSISESLFNWIAEELHMEALSERLFMLSNKSSHILYFLVEILSSGDYYGQEEIKAYIEEWQIFRRLTGYEKMKKKADGYLAYRRYIRAATIYDTIIDNREEVEDTVFLGNVYHNRGVAAANNFELEDAKRYFMMAYELNGNPDSLKGYFYVVARSEDMSVLREEIRQMDLDEEYFEEIINEIADVKDDVAEMTIYSMLERAVYNKMHKDINEYDKRMDIILDELKNEFREQAI